MKQMAHFTVWARKKIRLNEAEEEVKLGEQAIKRRNLKSWTVLLIKT